MGPDPQNVGMTRRLLRAAGRIVGDPPYRESLLLRAFGARGSFQPFTFTRPDRYPRIFRFVRDTLGQDGPHSILSFGCATGEEVWTLRRYFPAAAITGLDVNRAAIEACRKRLARGPDARLAFAVAHDLSGEASGHYDAIFCMAVLRDGRISARRPPRCDSHIRFADFANLVADFHRCLKPGGLLVLRYANFRLSDTPSAAQFDTLLALPVAKPIPLYGPDNRLLEGATDPDVVFRRRA